MQYKNEAKRERQLLLGQSWKSDMGGLKKQIKNFIIQKNILHLDALIIFLPTLYMLLT